MFFRMLAVASAALLLSTAAMAQDAPVGTGVSMMDGRCSKLTLGKDDATAQCKNQLGNVTLPDGSVTFIFTTKDKMVGFQGDGTAIKPNADGSVNLPLGNVSVGSGPKDMKQTKVSGACVFSNPYSGKPAGVKCSAKSKSGSFAATFLSNGKPPRAK